jgi:hypothetical protein
MRLNLKKETGMKEKKELLSVFVPSLSSFIEASSTKDENKIK